MMATAKTKRPLTTRTNDVDRLASKLGSRLKITDVPNNGVRTNRATKMAQTTKATRSAGESRAAAMKSVNNVLQSLASSARGRGETLRTSASSSATAGRAALNILRKLNPVLIDTERAALCMVGKLLSLNVYDAAIELLEDVRQHLPSLYDHEQHRTSTRTPISLLQLPPPVSSLDPALQTCIQTYLSHTFAVLAHVVSAKPGLFEAFCNELDSPFGLQSWSTFLTALPQKSLDGLFKRTYVALTTSFVSPSTPQLHVLKIRFHALRALLLSGELEITPFWEQCLKYAASYARDEGVKEEESEKIAVLLDCFARVEKAAYGRREGKGWIAFCEYWLALAKRARDRKMLNFIASYIRSAASSSSDVSDLIVRTCTSLTQLTAALDQTGDDEINLRADAAKAELDGLQTLLSSATVFDGKLWRTVEKCRKACTKALSRVELGISTRDSIVNMLVSIISLLERLIDASAGTIAERADATISALDSLLQLAMAIFIPERADICDQAYDYLMQGLRLVERCRSDDGDDKRAAANYLRCVSGTFANLAGALYKAERHGFAIRFLVQACALSTRATALYSESCSTYAASCFDKDRDVWLTHGKQVYRRWELLGVCYVKTGDRRLAHDAFVQGVITYPYEDELSSKTDLSKEFQLPSTLANAIDRLTHLAASELRLDPEKVSLRKALTNRGVPSFVAGSILSRQACSLSDRSKPHIRIAAGALLADILNVYDAMRFPIRRAQALVLVLEHTYYGGDTDSAMEVYRPESVVKESEALLSPKASIDSASSTSSGEDDAFTYLRPYCRTTISFWAVLHAHRAAAPTGKVEEHARNAIESLRMLVAETASASSAKGPTGSRGRKAASVTTSSVRSTSRATLKTVVAPPKTRIARSNSVRRPLATSDPSTGVGADKSNNSSQSRKHELSLSECKSLAELMLMVAELFGFSSLVLMKIHILAFVRRLLEKHDGAKTEAFLRASSILAHALANLGQLTMACSILDPLATEVCGSTSSDSSAILVLLRYAEILALSGDVSKSISIYEDAARLAEDLLDEESRRGISAVSRIRSRAVARERVAIASSVFATIQDTKNEPATSLRALLQALRLLNRATDTLARLNSTQKPKTPQDDPFSMSDVKDALPGSNGTTVDTGGTSPSISKVSLPRVHLDGLEWRIANALLETQLTLANSYASRGSVREAEYFEQQAEELARVLGTSAVTTRSLVQKADIQMSLGNKEEAQRILEEAMNLTRGKSNFYEVDTHRAFGDRLMLCSQEEDAQGEFNEAMLLLEETRKMFESSANFVSNASKSETEDAFAPVLQAKILRQQVWLLRDALGEKYEEFLEKLFALPQRPYIEVHVNSVLGRLALYDIHERFRADMSLSSLAESTIALPMGITSEKPMIPSPAQDILDALQQADEHYASDLSRFSERDSVINVRFEAVAAALISTYHASLGVTYEDSPAIAAHLLDMSCSITLRRELIDAISFKFPNPLDQDDMRWPSESPFTSQRRRAKPKGRGIFDNLSDDDDDDERSLHDNDLRQYWDYVLKKHQSEAFILAENSASEIDCLPDKWMVVTISLTEDKNALLLSRQRPKRVPMVFCIPLKDRREEEEDGHFTFDNAMAELKDIIKLNDEGARGASQIKSDDKEAKIAWWASRKQLDQRMKDLVENIEFCWLGAFKTVLSQPMRIPPDAISALRTRLEKVFIRILGSHEKKSKKAKLHLESNLLELFAALPPTCRDEELQDLMYFVLDLYHFHGLPVALAEIDIDLVVIDLRSALEEYHSRNRGKIVPEADAHTFLVLDKNVQGIPWESLPTLRGHNVSRVPSIAFIMDRLAWARSQRGLPLDPSESSEEESQQIDRFSVDPSRGYYMLNPSGDLAGTEGRFKGWVNDMKKVGWDGVIGKEPIEQQFLNALSRKDLVVYFGHGGAEQYARSHKIRHLQRCAATMLWGCSSGALREMGEFDRVGTPNNYMLAGCPSLVANLWDVTDRDIDKFAQSVFSKLRLEPGEVGQWQKGKQGLKDGRASIVAAVAQSRDVCKLKYLTGAAVVVYGIPYYL